jgi:hypothetical protein
LLFPRCFLSGKSSQNLFSHVLWKAGVPILNNYVDRPLRLNAGLPTDMDGREAACLRETIHRGHHDEGDLAYCHGIAQIG